MAETINMRPDPEGNGWSMSEIEKKGAEVMKYEAERRRERVGETVNMRQDPETGEWETGDETWRESFFRWFEGVFERKGEEVETEEAKQEKGLVRWERTREKKAASGALATFGSVAGIGAIGGLWTIGQALKYSLIGWTLDNNGIPRKDAAALKAYDDTYKAAKDEGILGGLAKGLGIAA